MRFALFLLCCFLSVSLYAATNYFFGSVYRDSCRGVDVISWTNCPPAVVVQTSTNLITWTDRMIVSFVGPTNAVYSFEWPETNMTHGAQFTRLREIQPLATPIR